MKPVAKAGVSLLSLLLFAAPIMACALPAMAMTAAERDCCKRMAGECGKKGMSHSCCQTTTAPDHLPAIKSSAEVVQGIWRWLLYKRYQRFRQSQRCRNLVSSSKLW